jgi:hypothetical protein
MIALTALPQKWEMLISVVTGDNTLENLILSDVHTVVITQFQADYMHHGSKQHNANKISIVKCKHSDPNWHNQQGSGQQQQQQNQQQQGSDGCCNSLLYKGSEDDDGLKLEVTGWAWNKRTSTKTMMIVIRDRVRSSMVAYKAKTLGGRQENSLRTVRWIYESLYTKYRWSVCPL